MIYLRGSCYRSGNDISKNKKVARISKISTIGSEEEKLS